MTTLLPTNTDSNVFKSISEPLFDLQKITDTLQGSIWRASTTKFNETAATQTIVAKLTHKESCNRSSAVMNDTVYHNIKENIVLEQRILKYLSQQTDCSPFITKHFSFIETDEHFVLLQEDGGHSLFTFVEFGHKFIKSGNIDLPHWKSVVKVISKQLVQSIAYIHSKNITHNDISLENFLINDVSIFTNEEGKIVFEIDEIQTKLCDFGLAELHNNSEGISSKHCGKRQYKSPEIISLKRHFNAKKNDIWGLGVCLFMLSFGCPPWNVAHSDDALFSAVMEGHMMDILELWDLKTYIDSHCIDFFRRIFVNEDKRINISQIKQHAFLQ